MSNAVQGSTKARPTGSGVRFIANTAAAICAAGLAAALGTHVVLQAIAAVGAGARAFELHAHGALEPVVFVELALVAIVTFFAFREYRASAGSIARAARVRVAPAQLLSFAVGIAAVASATLFGMEVAESAASAAGFGWLGGSLFPGIFVLAVAAFAAFAVLKCALDARYAGFQRLLQLLSKVLAAICGFVDRPLVARGIPAPAVVVARTSYARTSGLRAPPRFHY